MNRRQIHNAMLHAYGELDAEAAERLEAEAAGDAELRALLTDCTRLREAVADLPEPQLPPSLRGRAVQRPAARPHRRGWIGWTAAVAAAVVAAVMLGQLGRPQQDAPQTHPVAAKNPVYDDDEFDRQLAVAAQMAENISSRVLGAETWWDQSIQTIMQEIEALGTDLVDPTVPEAGSRPASHPA